MFNATKKYQKVNSGRTELSTFSQKTFLVNMVKFLTRLTMIQYEHYVCIYNIHTYIHAHFCLLILTRKIGFQNDCIFWLCPDYYRGTQDNIKSSCRFWKILIKKKNLLLLIVSGRKVIQSLIHQSCRLCENLYNYFNK